MEPEHFFGKKMIHHPWIILRDWDAGSHIVWWESRWRESGVDRRLQLQLNGTHSTVLQSSMWYKRLYRFLYFSLRALDAWCSTSWDRRYWRLCIVTLVQWFQPLQWKQTSTLWTLATLDRLTASRMVALYVRAQVCRAPLHVFHSREWKSFLRFVIEFPK